MSVFRGLPTLADLTAQPRAVPKGKTRLQVRAEARSLTTVDEKTFRAEVWRRDRNRCRCCGRKVQKTAARVPERGEVHHLHGRGKDLRFEARAAVLVCASCHERLTGRVNEKWIALATRTFTMHGEAFTDARHPITFRRAV